MYFLCWIRLGKGWANLSKRKLSLAAGCASRPESSEWGAVVSGCPSLSSCPSLSCRSPVCRSGELLYLPVPGWLHWETLWWQRRRLRLLPLCQRRDLPGWHQWLFLHLPPRIQREELQHPGEQMWTQPLPQWGHLPRKKQPLCLWVCPGLRRAQLPVSAPRATSGTRHRWLHWKVHRRPELPVPLDRRLRWDYSGPHAAAGVCCCGCLRQAQSAEEAPPAWCLQEWDWDYE